jgi:quercetin dioxygenase-like cupin family protein
MDSQVSGKPYAFFDSLTSMIGEIPSDSIISRTIYKDAQIKAVLFGFDAGQSLSEHSAGQAAAIHILSGSATLTVGQDTYEVEAGAWMHMQPRLAHSLVAHTPVVMLLLLLTNGA